MCGCHGQHQEAELFPHPQPAVEPAREPTVLGAAVQLDVAGDHTCRQVQTRTLTYSLQAHCTPTYLAKLSANRHCSDITSN